MPATDGLSCIFGEERSDLATHQMVGGNTWLLNAVRELFDDLETGLDQDSVDRNIAATVNSTVMLIIQALRAQPRQFSLARSSQAKAAPPTIPSMTQTSR